MSHSTLSNLDVAHLKFHVTKLQFYDVFVTLFSKLLFIVFSLGFSLLFSRNKNILTGS